MQALLDIVLPVFLLIAVGYGAFRVRLLDPVLVAKLSPLTFTLLMGPLLFRAMAGADLGEVQLGPTAAYYAASLTLYALVIGVQVGLRGVPRAQAIVHALTATFSNTAMIGIPIVTLAFGEAGLRILLPIIALHALVLLTLSTLVLEVDRARGRLGPHAADATGEGGPEPSGMASAEAAPGPGAPAERLRAVLARALRQSIVHPVVLPILLGLAWHAAGLRMPSPLDRTLAMLGSAGPTMCLLLLGGSLGQYGIARSWRGAIVFSACKSMLHPLAVLAFGKFALGLSGLPLAVAVVAGAMPIGGNVYLFSQRYGIEVGRVSAAVALSTLLSIPTLVLLLNWLA